jgi:hypothetical protein
MPSARPQAPASSAGFSRRIPIAPKGLDIAVAIIERAADAGIGSVAEIVAAIRAARNERG